MVEKWSKIGQKSVKISEISYWKMAGKMSKNWTKLDLNVVQKWFKNWSKIGPKLVNKSEIFY